MTKHVPLPSDPVAKAAEKRRRFKEYQKGWVRQRRDKRNAKLVAAYLRQRAEDQEELALRKAWRKARHYDLIGL
jgi:hypothetical protein